MTVSRVFLRLLRGGGRAGLVRLVSTVCGVAVGVAATILVWAVPSILDDRAVRVAEHYPAIALNGQQPSFRFRMVEDSWQGRRLTRIFVTAVSADPPPPPGVERLPGPGEVVVSPALAALASRPGVADRIPGQVTGRIARSGLAGSDDLLAYIGTDATMLRDGRPAVGWRGIDRVMDQTGEQQGSVALELALLIGGPALIYLFVCARLSAAARARRYAALRLIGTPRKQILSIAAMEAGMFGALGTVAGIGLYFVANPLLASTGVLGFKWFPERSQVTAGQGVAIMVIVVAASAVLGALGALRAVQRPLTTRFDVAEPRAHWWMAVPFAAGLALMAVNLWWWPAGSTGKVMGISAGGFLIAGMVLSAVSLAPALRPILSMLARMANRESMPLAIRVAARRLEFAPAMAVRLVVGLVILVIVGGVGAGIVRDMELAAGPPVPYHQVAMSGRTVPPEAQRRLLDLSANIRWASVKSVVEPPMGKGPPVTLDDHVRVLGVTMILARCEDARKLFLSALTGCAGGQMYRLRYPSSRDGANALPAGREIEFRDAAGKPVIVHAPTDSLEIKRLDPKSDLVTNLLVTADTLPTGWSQETVFHYVLPPSDSHLEGFLDEAAKVAPTSQVDVENRNLAALEAFRIHRGALRLGVWIGFLLGVMAFGIAAVDHSAETRRQRATLAVLGTPRRVLFGSDVLQLLAPLVVGLGLASLVAHLAGNTFLRLDGQQRGWFLGTLAMSLPMLAFGIAVVTVAAAVVHASSARVSDVRRE